MPSDTFLSALIAFGLLGLVTALIGAVKRSTLMLVFAGFLVLGATSFALTALVLA